MLDCSFGFRPGRSAHDALQVLIDESWRGRRWVVETDIANCLRGDSARRVDAGDRGTRRRPGRPGPGAHAAGRRGAAGRVAAARRGWHTPGWDYHAPNAMGNFCFEVTLNYRRLERPWRVSGTE